MADPSCRQLLPADICGLITDTLCRIDADVRFVGPLPCDCGATTAMDLRALLCAFIQAQGASKYRLPAWVNNKVERKERWEQLGVEARLIVPTLYTGELEWRGEREEVPFLVETDGGGFAPNLDQGAPILHPSDAGFEATLRGLLLEHRRLVLKPSKGANSVGVLLLSVEDDPLRGVPIASGFERVADAHQPPALQPAFGRGDMDPLLERVWVGAPEKSNLSTQDAASRVLFDHAYHQQILRAEKLIGNVLVEPSIVHDQEVCVLSMVGGRVQIIAGRSLVMNRILLFAEHLPIVMDDDFEDPGWPELYSGQWPVADPAVRERHTRWMLTRKLDSDSHGRSLCEVIRGAVRHLATVGSSGDGESSAFRADFFVNWGDSAGEGARVWLNEVEHGFNGGCTLGWFGQRCMQVALRMWVLGTDEAHRATRMCAT
mmetsp:Transcript_15235/g.33112  ORF Transcript_15235/g.33112 Transcript_15235/m.33112 type:complete len:431 (-) Transcript_15235:483-1775(-)